MNIVEALVDGGGTRLHLDSMTNANRYGCTPLPQTDISSFSSCSARTISPWSLSALEQECIEDFSGLPLDKLNTKMEKLRCNIADLLEISSMGAEIILSPSGTDATLHALFLVKALQNRPLDSIVLAPDESGSSIPLAAIGLHFDTQTPLGTAVVKGQAIAEWANDVRLLSILVHDAMGNDCSLDEIDHQVLEVVRQSIQANRYVLLHAMDRSKLGRSYPSHACLQAIRQRYGDKVQILVDCCQGRISRSRLKGYLSQGHLLTLTGSKFFTGPPFSGALLVPQQLATMARDITDVPSGLYDYTEANAWPQDWVAIRSVLPNTFNTGLYVRWFAALIEMRSYFSIPTAFRKQVLQTFADAILQILGHCPHVHLLSLSQQCTEEFDDAETLIPSIFPFFVRYEESFLHFTSTMALYYGLNQDITRFLPERIPQSEQTLATQRFQIGYPVCLGDLGVLRICSDARMVYEHWLDHPSSAFTNIENEMMQISAILNKIALILQYPSILKAFTPTSDRPLNERRG
jgi:hypothetical protein